MSGMDVQNSRILQNAQAPRSRQNGLQNLSQGLRTQQNTPPAPTAQPGNAQDINRSGNGLAPNPPANAAPNDTRAVGSWFSEMSENLQDVSGDIRELLESPNAFPEGFPTLPSRNTAPNTEREAQVTTQSSTERPDQTSSERSPYSWELDPNERPQQEREDLAEVPATPPGSEPAEPDYSQMSLEELEAEIAKRDESIANNLALIAIIDQMSSPGN
ncbi:MAG: hypothetical protein ACO1RX_19955 [Candidatus Sericytochromatia bacterium]